MKPFKYTLPLLLFLFICCNRQEKNLQEIVPPFGEFELPTAAKTIDPTMGQLVHFANGASIEVPANAFVYENGEVVKTPVELTMETYRSSAEIMASGIPLRYGDGSGERHFESAGMFELNGTADGGNIKIDPTKKLTVDFSSNAIGDFDLYYFEENKKLFGAREGTWRRLEKEKTREGFGKPKSAADFRLKFDKKEIPEMAALEGIEWHLATTNNNPLSKKNKWVLSEKWQGLEISQPKKGVGDPLYQGVFDHQDDMSLIVKRGDYILFGDSTGLSLFDNNGRMTKKIEGAQWYGGGDIEADNDEGYFFALWTDGIYLFKNNGERVGFYGESAAHDLCLKKNRVVFLKKEGEWDGSIHVFLTDLAGSLIEKFHLSLNHYHPNNEHTMPFQFTDDGYLMLNSDEGLTICDYNGKILATKPTRIKDVVYLGGNKIIGKLFTDQYIVWDFLKDKQTISKSTDFSWKYKKGQHAYFDEIPHPVNDLPIVWRTYEDGEGFSFSKIWDYEKNKTTDLNFRIWGTQMDTVIPELISGYNVNDSSLYVYNLRKDQLILALPDDEALHYDNYLRGLKKSKKLQRFIINTASHVKMYDLDGKLIKDFLRHDPAVYMADFKPDGKIYAFSKKGNYSLWDADGKLLSEKVNDNIFFSSVMENKGQIWAMDDVMDNVFIFDWLGEMIFHFPNYSIIEKMGNENMVYANTAGEFRMSPTFGLPPNVYQLILKSEKKDFITYVYLDEKTKEIINSCNSIRLEKIKEEKESKEEEFQVVRRFAIAEFGLYNFGRLINEGNHIHFIADFNFGGEANYHNGISVFMVTRLDGNAVVKFDKNTSAQFSIDPAADNKLLAVLPGNRLAVFTEERLSEVDWEAVEKEGRFVFEMAVVEMAVEGVLDLDEYL